MMIKKKTYLYLLEIMLKNNNKKNLNEIQRILNYSH